MRELGFKTVEELKEEQGRKRVYWEKGNTTNRISRIFERRGEDVGTDGESLMKGSGRSEDFSNN